MAEYIWIDAEGNTRSKSRVSLPHSSSRFCPLSPVCTLPCLLCPSNELSDRSGRALSNFRFCVAFTRSPVYPQMR